MSALALLRGLGASRREGWEDLRCRYLFRACDALLTAYGSCSSSPEPWGARPSNYHRVHAMAGTLGRTFPPFATLARRYLFRPEHLPFAAREVELLGFGTAATVFLLRRGGAGTADPGVVLKVFRKSLGWSVERVLRHVWELRSSYEAISGWYSDCALALPTSFLVLHGPLLGRAAAACLQPYVEGEDGGDLFERAHDPRLLREIREDASLREQVRRFVERTLEIDATRERCIDLVGGGNLLLVREEGRLRLRLLDFGVHDYAALRTEAPHRIVAVKERLTVLRRLLGQVLGGPAAGGPAPSREGAR